MARIRTLKPDIWTDEKFALLSTGAKLLFIGAISTADDAGRIRAHPALLKATVLPLDRATPQDITKWLRELEAASMIGLYQVRGEALAQLANWAKHQRIDNASRALENSMAQASAFYARGGEKVWAKGIMELVNKGLRQRFSMRDSATERPE